jgi:transcriptional regulator with XRE-family HTH domain
LHAVTAQNVMWLGPKLVPTVTLAMDDQRSEYMSSFGVQLRARRLEAGYTDRTKLAELVHVSEATFGRWENAQQLPDLWELRELCRVLGIEAVELLYPEPLSPRERLLRRRAARPVRAVR